jgi:hypothetical protein
MSKHTPGPWRWEFNAEYRRLHLVGGCRRFDLTIMDFERWGMNGATMRLRDPAHDGMQLLYRVHERPDWIAPEPGREHHKGWHQLLTHPDARLIEAAPDLLSALKAMLTHMGMDEDEWNKPTFDQARAAIKKAEGA